MATRWRSWIPRGWIGSLIRIMEWRPFHRIGGMILFEQYYEPKSWEFEILTDFALQDKKEN